MVGGVRFSCAAGDMDCVVKLMVDRDEDGMITNISADYEGGAVTAEFIDPAENFNDGDAGALAAIMLRGNSERRLRGTAHVTISGEASDDGADNTPLTGVTNAPTGPADAPDGWLDGFDDLAFGGAADDFSTPGDETLASRPRSAHQKTNTVRGLTSSTATPGIGAADMSEFVLRGNMNPNGAQQRYDDHYPNGVPIASPPTDVDESSVGSMMSAEEDAIDSMMAGAIGLGDPWNHMVLHADWGDTAATAHDGGHETLAAVYSDMEAPTTVAFAEVAGMLADTSKSDWFELHAVNGTVDVETGTSDNQDRAKGVVISVEDANIAALDIEVVPGTRIKGTFFGAEGVFTCLGHVAPGAAAQTDGGSCHLSRSETDAANYGVSDLDSGDPASLGAAHTTAADHPGTWRFKPESDATVDVPDQEWLAFGFWVTSPSDPGNGVHRLGVFYQGMHEYLYNNSTDPVRTVVLTTPAEYSDADNLGLRGTASYEGDAAGYYVDGMDDGVFTATANLTAVFNDNSSATTDHSVSGRIHDFRRSDGSYLGADTPANPNDPTHGGEGDWYVNLGTSSINQAAVPDDAGPYVPAVGIGPRFSNASGAADGVSWSGAWNAQLYGTGYQGGNTTKKTAPSGVAGAFRAVTSELDGGGYKGVIGTFGAQLTGTTGP